MCGICGIAAPSKLNRRVDEAVLVRMRDVLTHRGPDDAGVYHGGAVALGHRRLSIVDLGGGKQPMTNEDGTVWITFNGEIYNHAELRPGLEDRGHKYETACDTETIIHLYEERGPRVVEELRGMFTFAIWDRRQRKLLLARDRLGIKPLYYTLTGEGVLYFASEIKAIVEAGAVRPELNYNALADYAANRYTSGEETMFRGVKRLLPGHTLVWEEGRVEINRYWDVSFEKPAESPGEREYVEQFDYLFREAVKLRLMADVPLGMFLSGGIDSSAIAAVMSEMVAEPIKTFSVAFAEREANELEYARVVARAYSTDHHEIVISPAQFFQALPSLVYQEDEPIAHPSSLPLYFVSKLAAEHVKVVLTGEGADEMLAGYGKYRTTMYNLALGRAYTRATPESLRRAVRRAVEGAPIASRIKQKLARTFLFQPPNIEDIYFDNFSVFSRSMQESLFTGGTRERLGESDPYRSSVDCMKESDASELLDQLLAADMKTYLQELLMKQDQMSMAASIESRVPFLDHKLVEFAARMPVGMKLRGLTTKYVLRRAMRDRLPKEILTRKKMGFPVPVGSWLRGPFRHVVDEYVLGPRASERGIFDHGFVESVVARHMAGENHDERLWSLINFEIWQRQFIDREDLGKSVGSPFEPVGALRAATSSRGAASRARSGIKGSVGANETERECA
ncbi:MAG TPA: asparagine synthase (glutamine-hydrolyzing) [Blastocatellia bacterium]|nr:asparagine synthase (glutamine-hydrolyzing) [Blastocatellia bacterium]